MADGVRLTAAPQWGDEAKAHKASVEAERAHLEAAIETLSADLSAFETDYVKVSALLASLQGAGGRAPSSRLPPLGEGAEQQARPPPPPPPPARSR